MHVAFKTGYLQDIRLIGDRRTGFKYGLLIAVAVMAPFLLDDFMIGEATTIVIWAIAGMGLMVLTGHAGQVSLGHAVFLAVGCYAHALLMAHAALPFPLAFLLAGMLTGLAGVLVAVPALRLHGIYLAIATLALSMLTEDIIILAEPWTGGIAGMTAAPIAIAGIGIDRFTTPDRFYWLCLAVAVAVTLGYANLLRAPLGRAMAALRESEMAARATGIDPARTKAVAFGLSTMVTGWAGALMGHAIYTFNHEAFTVIISIQLLLMIIVGGMGSIHGAWYGALVVGGIPQLIAMARDAASVVLETNVVVPGLETGLFGIVLILIVLFEPRGIHGRLTAWKAWFELFPLARRRMFRRQRSYLRTERLR